MSNSQTQLAASAEELHSAVLRLIYQDRPGALEQNAKLQVLAKAGDVTTQAWAARAQGHIEHVAGDYDRASYWYEKAADLFASQHQDLEVGRSLLSGLQALIYRGDYDRAHAWANRAETIFHRQGDLLRLARLDSNVGNIYFRQDRPHDAVARYQRALEGFEVAGEPRDIAAALSNLAVASINLGQFSEALGYYERARAHSEAHSLWNLVARADYNIAYLYYLRGNYADARRLYDLSRQRSRETEDAYHLALCNLDEAEMYLELNLIREGEALASQAVEEFSQLAMPYEQAKALVNLAVAASHRRDFRFADKTLMRARRLFVVEKNPVWPALVDQLRAVLAFHELRFDQAYRLSNAAWRMLTKTMIPGRAAHCQILLARLWLKAGYADRARAIGREAVEAVGEDLSPSLRFHAHLVEGEIHELQGRWQQALASYEAARREVEDLRGRVDTEDLRISILKDKLAVYEGLVALCLDSPAAQESGGAERALLLVQQAKSRSLADRLGTYREYAPEPDRHAQLRGDLNWIYRQIDRASESPGNTQVLRARAMQMEAELGAGGTPAPQEVADLQSALRDGEVLLEYYETRGVLYVLLLSSRGVEAVRLGAFAPVRQTLKLLQFQLGRFRWGKECITSPDANLDAASHHFRELYRLLMAPLEDRLTPYRHLIVAPHRELHGLPFAALNDGTYVLADRFGLSATPSASVLHRCRSRRLGPARPAVVMAVSDAAAPRMEEEARAVAQLLPGSSLLLGQQVTIEAFCRRAPSAGILHLAAHGIFRKDNPMFSALQLADGRLSLLDLNRMELNVDLLTLSACNTGSSVAVGGDELLGLMRGFLLAGARSLLVTLWEINDTSTLEFMIAFYKKISTGVTLATALREAARELRNKYPHPYYWAPFLLVGDPDALGADVPAPSSLP